MTFLDIAKLLDPFIKKAELLKDGELHNVTIEITGEPWQQLLVDGATAIEKYNVAEFPDGYDKEKNKTDKKEDGIYMWLLEKHQNVLNVSVHF